MTETVQGSPRPATQEFCTQDPLWGAGGLFSPFSFQVLLIKKRMQMCVYLHFQLRLLVQKTEYNPKYWE